MPRGAVLTGVYGGVRAVTASPRPIAPHRAPAAGLGIGRRAVLLGEQGRGRGWYHSSDIVRAKGRIYAVMLRTRRVLGVARRRRRRGGDGVGRQLYVEKRRGHEAMYRVIA